ncbi:hypothetical protein GCM10027190_38170 [Spirosoma areae]
MERIVSFCIDKVGLGIGEKAYYLNKRINKLYLSFPSPPTPLPEGDGLKKWMEKPIALWERSWG